MVQVSDTVAVACANCHEPYRDFDDQRQRCTPGGVTSAGD
jgi:cytochrome c peroxidase